MEATKKSGTITRMKNEQEVGMWENVLKSDKVPAQKRGGGAIQRVTKSDGVKVTGSLNKPNLCQEMDNWTCPIKRLHLFETEEVLFLFPL